MVKDRAPYFFPRSFRVFLRSKNVSRNKYYFHIPLDTPRTARHSGRAERVFANESGQTKISSIKVLKEV